MCVCGCVGVGWEKEQGKKHLDSFTIIYHCTMMVTLTDPCGSYITHSPDITLVGPRDDFSRCPSHPPQSEAKYCHGGAIYHTM